MTDLANSFTLRKKLGLVVYSSINDSLYHLVVKHMFHYSKHRCFIK